MKRQKIKKEVLIEEYITKNQSVTSVAKIIGKSEAATRWWLGKYKINKKHMISDLTGQRFERLLVLHKDKIVYKNRSRTGYKCLCDCGNKLTIDINSLKSGRTKSCGCYFRDIILTGCKELSGQQWSRIKYSATIRNLEFNINVNQAYDLYIKQNKKCALSGVPINLNKVYKGNAESNTASLDRIDSAIGYVDGNVQFISIVMNHMKGDMSHKKTLEIIELIKKS